LNAPTRPILRYHGGKWKLAPWIIAHFPEHRVYVEPFGGGASVLLRKSRSYAEVYNDLDGEIVNLFRVARDRGAELREAVRLTPFAREEFDQSYEPVEDPVEQARRTLIRSFAGFGSGGASGNKTGFRSNTTRSGTTPAGDWANMPEALDGVIDRLRRVVIENSDALAVMAAHDSPITLHYVDPPYVWSTRKSGNKYCKKGYRHEMDDDQHRTLSAFLHGLAGFVVLSGYESPLYDELYADWTRVHRAALADGAEKRVEYLWLSPRVEDALHNPFMEAQAE